MSNHTIDTKRCSSHWAMVRLIAWHGYKLRDNLGKRKIGQTLALCNLRIELLQHCANEGTFRLSCVSECSRCKWANSIMQGTTTRERQINGNGCWHGAASTESGKLYVSLSLCLAGALARHWVWAQLNYSAHRWRLCQLAGLPTYSLLTSCLPSREFKLKSTQCRAPSSRVEFIYICTATVI